MILKYKDIDVFYETYGDGEAILLLHGFLEDSTMWYDIKEELSKSNLIILIDLPGHGKTECIEEIHTMEVMAEVVKAVLDALNVEIIYVVGHSMGGYVALALAEIIPKRIIGLCLMNSTFEADTKERIVSRKRSISMARKHYKRVVEQTFTNLFAPKNKTKYNDAYNSALSTALKTSTRAFIASQEGMLLRPNRFRILLELNAKKVIIVGKKDNVINTNIILKKTNNTSIEVLKCSGGHMSHIEDYKNLLTYLVHFIEK